MPHLSRLNSLALTIALVIASPLALATDSTAQAWSMAARAVALIMPKGCTTRLRPPATCAHG